jgi:hypothetical protein
MGGQHAGIGRELRQPVGRGVLVPGEGVGVLGAEQVRAADRAVQQRAAGEHPDGRPAGFVELVQGVGQMREGVAGGGEHRDPHPVADPDDVAVAHRHPFEGDVVVGVDVVGRAGRLGQGEAAGHVVVVDVRLEHVGDPHARLGGQRQDAIDVALRVHHDGHFAVVGQVAAIAERGGVERNDGRHRRSLLSSSSWVVSARGGR